MGKKNVFMTSMYFFIPLNRIGKRYKSDMHLDFKEKPTPAFAKNTQANCKAAEIVFDEKERAFGYTYITKKGDERISREVELKAYILLYTPFRAKTRPSPILMIGTSIDKVFAIHDTSNNYSFDKALCSEDDLVMLKRAFCSNEHGVLIRKHDNQHFQQCLKALISKIECRKERKLHVEHSVIDVKGVALVTDSIMTKHRLDLNFAECYYDAPDDLSSLFIGDYQKFIYGLLFTNDNYHRVPESEIDHCFKDAYSNNKTEIVVAAPKSIVFLHTRFPFRRNINEKSPQQSGFCKNLSDVQNIYEMCEVLHAEKQFCLLRQALTLPNSSAIISVLLHLSQYMEKEYFHLAELDRKLNYIFKAVGISKQFSGLKEIASMAAKSAEIKVSHSINLWVLLFAVISSLFAFIQIGQNSDLLKCTNMANELLCDCGSIQINCCAIFGVMIFIIKTCTITLTVFSIMKYFLIRKTKEYLKMIAEVNE